MIKDSNHERATTDTSDIHHDDSHHVRSSLIRPITSPPKPGEWQDVNKQTRAGYDLCSTAIANPIRIVATHFAHWGKRLAVIGTS